MKSYIVLNACAALLLAPLTSTHAQAWQPILDIDGKSDRAMLVDPFSPDPSLPNLIVAGDVYGVQNGFLHRLSQQDSTIAPLDPDNHSLVDTCGLSWDGNPSSPGYGNVYLAGIYSRQTASGGSVYNWTLRRGTGAATSWVPVDDFSLADAWSEARGVTVDDQGKVYVCGMALDASGISHWIIRKSTDQGVHWQTQDLFKGNESWSLTGYNAVSALGINFVTNSSGPGGALFAVGTRGKLYSGAWTVIRSIDGGTNWKIVDSDAWVPKNTGTSRARKVAADSTGRIFVLGDTGSRMEHDPSPWVVRMSSDSGNTWRTIFGPWNYGPCPYPLDLTIDAGGNVWAVGVTHKKYGTKTITYTSQATWVRLSETTPGTWTSSYGFLTDEAQGQNRALAEAVVTDGAGRVYVSGSIQPNSASSWQWFVQRMAP